MIQKHQKIYRMFPIYHDLTMQRLGTMQSSMLINNSFANQNASVLWKLGSGTKKPPNIPYFQRLRSVSLCQIHCLMSRTIMRSEITCGRD